MRLKTLHVTFLLLSMAQSIFASDVELCVRLEMPMDDGSSEIFLIPYTKMEQNIFPSMVRGPSLSFCSTTILRDGDEITNILQPDEVRFFCDVIRGYNAAKKNHAKISGVYDGTSKSGCPKEPLILQPTGLKESTSSSSVNGNPSSEPTTPRSISSNNAPQGSHRETPVNPPSAPSTLHNNARTSKSYVDLDTSLLSLGVGLLAADCAKKYGASTKKKYAIGIAATTGMSAVWQLRQDNTRFTPEEIAAQLLVDNALYIAGQALFDYVLGKPKTVSHTTSVQPKDNKTAHRTLAEECAGSLLLDTKKQNI